MTFERSKGDDRENMERPIDPWGVNSMLARIPHLMSIAACAFIAMAMPNAAAAFLVPPPAPPSTPSVPKGIYSIFLGGATVTHAQFVAYDWFDITPAPTSSGKFNLGDQLTDKTSGNTGTIVAVAGIRGNRSMTVQFANGSIAVGDSISSSSGFDGTVANVTATRNSPAAAALPAYPNPALASDPTDAVLVNYFEALLNNPTGSSKDSVIAGLAPILGWQELNPLDPGSHPDHPDAGAYTWNLLDDVFEAIQRWNRAHDQ